MARKIGYWDVDREDYERGYQKEWLENELKNYQIISIETLEHDIRFWYNKED